MVNQAVGALQVVVAAALGEQIGVGGAGGEHSAAERVDVDVAIGIGDRELVVPRVHHLPLVAVAPDVPVAEPARAVGQAAVAVAGPVELVLAHPAEHLQVAHLALHVAGVHVDRVDAFRRTVAWLGGRVRIAAAGCVTGLLSRGAAEGAANYKSK